MYEPRRLRLALWSGPLLFIVLFLALGLVPNPERCLAKEATDGAVVQTWFALPTISYDTDNGLAFGGVVGLVLEAGDDVEGDHRLFAQGKVSLKGYQSHRLNYELEGFGPGRRFGIGIFTTYRKWKSALYYGIGNDRLRSRQFEGPFPEGSPKSQMYIYGHQRPSLNVTVDAEVRPWLQVFFGLSPRWSGVHVYADSLLEIDSPVGVDGGWVIEALAGLVFDSRMYGEADGFRLEVSGRHTLPLPADVRSGTFGGFNANLQGFLSFYGRVTLATRIMLDWLVGVVPFDEMNQWGGRRPAHGFGGGETLRGVMFGRWRGARKAIWNTELRLDLGRYSVRDSTLRLEVVPFVDLGLILDGIEQELDTIPFYPIHPSTGLGARIIYDQNFIARLDFGVGIDSVLETDGTVVAEPSYGFYLLAEQLF